MKLHLQNDEHVLFLFLFSSQQDIYPVGMNQVPPSYNVSCLFIVLAFPATASRDCNAKYKMLLIPDVSSQECNKQLIWVDVITNAF